MFLRVVCQRCGKNEIIDTRNHNNWLYFFLSEFLHDAGYWDGQCDVWLCRNCERVICTDTDERKKLVEFLKSGIRS